MLKILEIDKTQEMFNYLADKCDEIKPVFIAPNPQVADTVRSRFDALGKQVESITISKFIKNELNMLFSEEELEGSYKGKADLILLLGSVWKKIGKTQVSEFKRAFNLLTEFRSFTMSELVLETVLENYDDTLREGVLWLHGVLDQLDIIDEHRSYFLLSDRLREGSLPPEYPEDRSIIFYGFDFMTGSQVDLLKSFSIRNDIYIPFYKNAVARAQSSDWIKWLDEHNTEHIDLAVGSEKKNELDTITYPKNYLGKMLKTFCEHESSDFSIVLATKNLNQEELSEVPFHDYSTKIGVNLFEADFEEAFTVFEKIYKADIDVNSVRVGLRNEIEQRAIRSEYRLVKCLLITLNKLNEWEALSDANNEVSDFDFAILKEATELDLPRLNRTALIQEVTDKSIYSLRDIEKIKNKNVIMALNSNHGSIKGIGSNYSENVEKYLTSIGPIRRAELEVQIFKSKIAEFVDDNNVSFLVEDLLLEHDSSWSAVLEEYEFINKDIPLDFNKEAKYIPLEIEHKTVQKMSASRLQKYIECPKKYYYTVIEKKSPEVQFDDELNVLELGQLEHKVIEDYFNENDTLIDGKLIELITENLNIFCDKKLIDAKNYRIYYIEVLSYTRKCIQSLYQLKESLDLNYQFEFAFRVGSEIKFNGSIDCLAEDKIGKTTIIIDFKRSNRVFTSFSSIMAFEQVQLWFYLQRMKELEKINFDGDLAIGYVDLSDFENSMFFINNKELGINLKKMGINKIKVLDNFETYLDEYKEFENTYLEKLCSDNNFNANPLNAKSCDYCPLSAICSREGRE